jgi:hypothetical protein
MNRSLRYKILILCMTFVIAFTMTIPAAAEDGIITGDTIPANTIYDHDAILIGQNVTIDGTIDGNAFILGNQVTLNGKVNGSIILLGQNAGIGGVVTGEVYAVALTLDLAPKAVIGRDLYVATVSMTSGAGSLIGRDLFALGLDSGLNGQVGRDLHTVIGPIQLYNGLMTLLGLKNLTIKLHFETPAPSPTSSGSTIPFGQMAAPHLANLRHTATDPAGSFDWGKWALDLLRNWAVLFVFGLLVFWLGRKPLLRSGETLQVYPWKALGIGILVLAFSVATVGVAFLLFVITFAIGLGFILLGVWPVAIALWALAFACLAVFLVTLWAFIIYGTKIIVLFLAGTWIFERLFKLRKIWLVLLAFLAISLIYSLLRSIPYVGWIFGFLVSALGAGAAWLTIRGTARNRQPVGVKPEIVATGLPQSTAPSVQETSPALMESKPGTPSTRNRLAKPASVPVDHQPKPKATRKKGKPVEPGA